LSNSNASTCSEHCRAQLISILINHEDLKLPSSFRPILLLDTFGKLCGNTFLTSILTELRRRGLLRAERFDFRTKQYTSLRRRGEDHWRLKG
jgi:hypothetical protein